MGLDLELILGVLVLLAIALLAMRPGDDRPAGTKGRVERTYLEASARWGGQHWHGL